MGRSGLRSKGRGRKRAKAQRRRNARVWVIGTVISVTVLAILGAIVVRGVVTIRAFKRTITSPEQVQRIAPAHAKALADKGEAILYDTRTIEKYRAKHAAGAISFPEADREALVDLLPPDKVLIFY